MAAGNPGGGVPAISILMPVRDGAAFLDAALASLAEQTFENFEIIAIDNGSSDGTGQILAEWAGREPRLRCAYLARPRLSSALNMAAAPARAPLLARLDADDVAFPHRLELQIAAMQARPELALLGSAATLIDGCGRRSGKLSLPLLDRDIRRMQRTSAALIASTTILRASAFQLAGGYREGLNVSEDFDLWLRMSESGELANLAEPLIGYRVHSRSITARQPDRMAIASLAVTAASKARAAGAPEPFMRGIPSLRRALPLLGLSRAQARRSVHLRRAVNLLGRGAFAERLPFQVRRGLHSMVRLFRFKRLYRRVLRITLGDRQAGPAAQVRAPQP